jgi:hypothetical protein
MRLWATGILLCISWLIAPVWSKTDIPLPPKTELNVPFLCQAPFGNWEQPWQDACEEAAIIMAMHYAHNQPLTKKSGKQEILKLIAFQRQNYGGHDDLTAEKATQLIKDYYQVPNVTLLSSFEVEDIKKILAKGNLVIAPAAGRQLKNPYFHQPGPPYHYLVFKGYDDTKQQFITNDPGTRRGEGLRYPYKTAYAAIHDWTGSRKTISQGRKVIMVINR